MTHGDLVGFQTSGFFAFFIRLGQRLRGVKHRGVTHIAVIVEDGDDPMIVQSVRLVNSVRLSSYGTTPRVLIPFPGFAANRVDVVDFAKSEIGRKYGVLSVITRAVNCLTPRFIQIGASRLGDMDCATLGARAFEHGGVLLAGPDPWQYFPGELADEFVS